MNKKEAFLKLLFRASAFILGVGVANDIVYFIKKKQFVFSWQFYLVALFILLIWSILRAIKTKKAK